MRVVFVVVRCSSRWVRCCCTGCCCRPGCCRWDRCCCAGGCCGCTGCCGCCLTGRCGCCRAGCCARAGRCGCCRAGCCGCCLAGGGGCLCLSRWSCGCGCALAGVLIPAAIAALITIATSIRFKISTISTFIPDITFSLFLRSRFQPISGMKPGSFNSFSLKACPGCCSGLSKRHARLWPPKPTASGLGIVSYPQSYFSAMREE